MASTDWNRVVASLSLEGTKIKQKVWMQSNKKGNELEEGVCACLVPDESLL